VGIVPALMALRGLSYSIRPVRQWVARSGARVTGGDTRHAIPYGIDRAAYVILATEARLQGPRVQITPGRVREMMRLSWTTAEVAKRLQRVAYSITEMPRHAPECACGCHSVPRRALVADAVDWREGVFTIELNEAFMYEVEHGAPVLLAAAARLLPTCAAFDRFAWLIQHAKRGDRGPLPMFGEGGLCRVMATARSDGKARQSTRGWMQLIREVWPECPYALDVDGNAFICIGDPVEALAAHLGAEYPLTPLGLSPSPVPVTVT
jgi:hypothetical protein